MCFEILIFVISPGGIEDVSTTDNTIPTQHKTTSLTPPLLSLFLLHPSLYIRSLPSPKTNQHHPHPKPHPNSPLQPHSLQHPLSVLLRQQFALLGPLLPSPRYLQYGQMLEIVYVLEMATEGGEIFAEGGGDGERPVGGGERAEEAGWEG